MDERYKYIGDLSWEKARSYFCKFVRTWKKETLPRSIHARINLATTASASHTRFKYGFPQKANRAEQGARECVRGEVGSLTWARSGTAQMGGEGESSVLGSERPRSQGLIFPWHVTSG
ncbi:hypothetical protein CALVIDRAFT_373302 [Calocera viscosa TUFC12733]|uniref:Uncharacterized protein n=1 Tax=Calocera viscosa (strain TUFC12733) TaxID=1330018 RepID=A0A167GU11_CALVF|nr:hypothetical protein CALVIDRAFT_373302 [Calocera viscosa TUFC12733]